MRPVIEFANEAIRLTDLARQTPAPDPRKALLLLAAHYRDIANGIVSASDEDEEALAKSDRDRRPPAGATASFRCRASDRREAGLDGRCRKGAATER